MKKTAFALVFALVATPAFATDAVDQYLVDNGYLSPEVEQTLVIHTRPATAADATEAYLVDNGFLAPRREVVGYSAYTQVVPEFRDAAEELLSDWGYIHKPRGTVSHVVADLPQRKRASDSQS